MAWAVAGLAAFIWTDPARADWPGWRGPARDGFTQTPLPANLPDSPDILWRFRVTPGYAGPVVAGDRVIVLDAAQDRETAHCLDRHTGEVLWSRPFAPAWGDEFEPGPRCTPQIHDGRVYLQSTQGRFECVDLQTGEFQWGFHFEDLGTQWIPDRHSATGAATRRGHTGSPILHGDQIIVQVGSPDGACLVSLDRKTGREHWRSLNDLSAYTSPMVATMGGKLQVITATCEGLVGVDLEGGQLLWRVPFRTQANRNVLTPVISGNDLFFASFTTGLQAYTVQPAPGSSSTPLTAHRQWHLPELGINLSSPVLVGNHLYGLGARKDFVCVDTRSGTLRWSMTGFGEVASTLAHGNRLLVLLDTGECRLLEATPERYTELGRVQVCGKTFSHPAYSNGVLHVRDSRSLTALRLDPAQHGSSEP